MMSYESATTWELPLLLPWVGAAVVHHLRRDRFRARHRLVDIGGRRLCDGLGVCRHVCHHLVDALGVGLWRLNLEARGDEGGLIQKLHHVGTHSAVLVGLKPRLEALDNRAVGVELHDLAALHVLHGAVVAHRLSLHDALHVGAPAKLGGHQDAGRVAEALGDHHLFHLITQSLFHPSQHGFELLGGRLGGGLLFLCLLELKVLLGHVHHLHVLKLGQVGHTHLVDGLREVQNLVSAIHEVLNERGAGGCILAVGSHVVDDLLVLLFPLRVLLKADLVIP
mmetsp:Transcript_810/g.2455  ORF Transcript_810/g.2455 Transcript_810/m.2455 type:complete len:280 (+) Transcript_810:143-982(+)